MSISLKNFFNGIFGKEKKEEKKSAFPSLVEQIRIQMNLLVEKSGNLNDQFAEEKRDIVLLAGEASFMEQSQEILAAKLEQDILGRITAVSSACDFALSDKENTVKKEIASLKAKMSQRCALK